MGVIDQNEIQLVAKQDKAPLLFQFFNEIGIIDQLACSKLEGVLPDGLKISHFTVLNHLVRLEDEWSPVRIAKALQVTKAAITNTLQRLESRELVKIEADPRDGRGKLVCLTMAGRDVREQCIRNIEPFLDNLEKEFGGRKFEKALPFLEEVRNYLDEHRG